MDWREILALVLGSNGVMLLGNYLMVRRRFTHERKWNVRSEPLMRLRGELANMAQVSESAIDLATQFARERAMGKEVYISIDIHRFAAVSGDCFFGPYRRIFGWAGDNRPV